MGRVLLEIAVDSAGDAVAAAQAGADRLELCARLDLDGLTPEAGAVREVLARVTVPVVVMIRPRPGDFVYSAAELTQMAADIRRLAALRPAGFAFGATLADGAPEVAACTALVKFSRDTPCVYHRAFDRAPDPLAALEDLIRLGFRRVLTSGGAPSALQGATRIAELIRAAGSRIEVLPGGGIRAGKAAAVAQASGCVQVHSSARAGGRLDAEEVVRLRQVLDKPE
ncbi:MAG: copper homeostasis protein CutC [Planctomycetota bacterium]|nr:MAG: copper homeostasis protein CutC [Planctomycetota bacterium]